MRVNGILLALGLWATSSPLLATRPSLGPPRLSWVRRAGEFHLQFLDPKGSERTFPLGGLLFGDSGQPDKVRGARVRDFREVDDRHEVLAGMDPGNGEETGEAVFLELIKAFKDRKRTVLLVLTSTAHGGSAHTGNLYVWRSGETPKLAGLFDTSYATRIVPGRMSPSERYVVLQSTGRFPGMTLDLVDLQSGSTAFVALGVVRYGFLPDDRLWIRKGREGGGAGPGAGVNPPSGGKPGEVLDPGRLKWEAYEQPVEVR